MIIHLSRVQESLVPIKHLENFVQFLEGLIKFKLLHFATTQHKQSCIRSCFNPASLPDFNLEFWNYLFRLTVQKNTRASFLKPGWGTPQMHNSPSTKCCDPAAFPPSSPAAKVAGVLSHRPPQQHSCDPDSGPRSQHGGLSAPPPVPDSRTRAPCSSRTTATHFKYPQKT